jgi:hypothetical protein
MLVGNQQRRQAKQDAPSLRPFIQTLADIIHNASALWRSLEGLVENFGKGCRKPSGLLIFRLY